MITTELIATVFLAIAVLGCGINLILRIRRDVLAARGRATSATKEFVNNAPLIGEHMKKLAVISKEQKGLIAGLESPTKNGLHSKHKGDAIDVIRDLEEEKVDIMKSILLLGQDPAIVIINEHNEREQIRMSDYLHRVRVSLGHDIESETKNNLRSQLTLVKGGKVSEDK